MFERNVYYIVSVGKQEAVKPPRGLTKQKAVVSLKNVVQEQPTRVMPKRKSTEKAAEPMEISKEVNVFPNKLDCCFFLLFDEA